MALVRPQLSAPGVYVQEVPSGVRTITGVSTALTVFFGRARRGPVDQPVRISSHQEFEEIFGGLMVGAPMTYSVQDFFLNGGTQAVIVRLFEPPASAASAAPPTGDTHSTPHEEGTNPEQHEEDSSAAPPFGSRREAQPAPSTPPAQNAKGKASPYSSNTAFYAIPAPTSPTPPSGTPAGGTASAPVSASTKAPAGPAGASAGQNYRLVASSPGRWGARLSFVADTRNITKTVQQRYATEAWDATDLFNLSVTYVRPDNTWDTETFSLVSLKPEAGARFLGVILEQTSSYVRLAATSDDPAYAQDPAAHQKTLADSGPLGEETYLKALDDLDRLDVYNILCLPSDSFDGAGDIKPNVYAAAAAKCRDMKATLLLDPPFAWTHPTNIDPEHFSSAFGFAPAADVAAFSALYYPRVVSGDPLRGDAEMTRPACGILAGIMARTDFQRGVWKAPAGYETGLTGILRLAYNLTDDENGVLNSQGVNCLRSFTSVGPVVWGARTLAGADVLASDFKYLPVRRLTDYIEQTLLRQTRWAVFEPNDEPLWSQLRLAVGNFMNDLFRQGAFQGSSRAEAFFVKCDSSTTTQDDINRGIVNIEVGFAPLKPAEFIVIYIEQSAGKAKA
jgi:phage tail sheath protein FI